MTDYVVQSQYLIPNVLTNTTQQSAAEINSRYQAIANCGEFLRLQSVTLRNAATALLAEIDAALSNFTAQQTRFNNQAISESDKVNTANTTQASALASTNRITTNNAAVVTARGKLTTAENNANGVLTNGMIRSSGNLDAIAAATLANPGILGISAAGAWQWYNAPSGSPFVIEYQVFSTEYGSTSNGGSVTANTWNIVDINKATYGNFKNAINFPQNVVEETNDRLKLQNYTHNWHVVILGSNTDTMRARMLLDGAALGRSLSTQMAADTNTNTLRHFNQDLIVDEMVIPTVDPAYLQFQTYHNSVNPAIATAARGLSGNKGNLNLYMVGYGWRIRNI